MFKKGFSLVGLVSIYTIVVIAIFVFFIAKIESNKDDTSYYLEFYSKDIAQGSQALLWAEGEGDYVYTLRENFEISINNKGKVFVKSGRSHDEYKFETREGYFLDVSNLEDNSYLISKREVVV